MKVFSSDEYDMLHGVLSETYTGYDFRTLDEYFDLNNVDESKCSDSAMKIIMSKYNNTWQWNTVQERPMSGHIAYIVETLKSHDSQSLINKIEKELSEYIEACVYDKPNYDKYDIIVIMCDTDNPFVDDSCLPYKKLLYNKISEKLKTILEQWLYNVTLITKTGFGYNIYLEPVYTECVSGNLKKYIYHITDKKSALIIKEKGIRTKTYKDKKYINADIIQGNYIKDGNNIKYRYFPERIYFINGLETKRQTINNLNKAIKDLRKTDDYAIISVDTSIYDIDFWKDPATTSFENAIYTHTYIPSELIARISYDINDIKYE